MYIELLTKNERHAYRRVTHPYNNDVARACNHIIQISDFFITAIRLNSNIIFFQLNVTDPKWDIA